MRILSLALCTLLLLSACGGEEPRLDPGPAEPALDGVVLDHILIAVKNPRIPSGKTPEEAKTIAYDLLKQLEAGANWAELKRKHSADPPPGGPYTILNKGQPDRANFIFVRGDMAPAFEAVGYSLDVGKMGIADFDPRTSPFGFHIIKRVK